MEDLCQKTNLSEKERISEDDIEMLLENFLNSSKDLMEGIDSLSRSMKKSKVQLKELNDIMENLDVRATRRI